MCNQRLIRRFHAPSGLVYIVYMHRVMVEGGAAESCGVGIFSEELCCRQDDLTTDRAAAVQFMESLCANEVQPAELYDLAEDFLTAVS